MKSVTIKQQRLATDALIQSCLVGCGRALFLDSGDVLVCQNNDLLQPYSLLCEKLEVQFSEILAKCFSKSKSDDSFEGLSNFCLNDGSFRLIPYASGEYSLPQFQLQGDAMGVGHDGALLLDTLREQVPFLLRISSNTFEYMYQNWQQFLQDEDIVQTRAHLKNPDIPRPHPESYIWTLAGTETLMSEEQFLRHITEKWTNQFWRICQSVGSKEKENDYKKNEAEEVFAQFQKCLSKKQKKIGAKAVNFLGIIRPQSAAFQYPTRKQSTDRFGNLKGLLSQQAFTDINAGIRHGLVELLPPKYSLKSADQQESNITENSETVRLRALFEGNELPLLQRWILTEATSDQLYNVLEMLNPLLEYLSLGRLEESCIKEATKCNLLIDGSTLSEMVAYILTFCNSLSAALTPDVPEIRAREILYMNLEGPGALPDLLAMLHGRQKRHGNITDVSLYERVCRRFKFRASALGGNYSRLFNKLDWLKRKQDQSGIEKLAMIATKVDFEKAVDEI
eukprot:Gregarina_sp_Poly_1__369@NODE_1090_length_5127_cov_141_584585_g756_i0_p2_GENE_NODE_1090_length_5127_cov_141_584585_g756_i0NODE_1090_length_5127_cov_141_584585_g756_i0_p2_ORF_typecomplete_len508_score70_61ASXH/PF13919_6/2_1ASXH/PF13919_6/2_4_NODE_1090_length_5127_cov_141_584585_g756_i033784901